MVAMSTSFPSASASVHHSGACASLTTCPLAPRHRRDLAGLFDMVLAQPEVVIRDRDEANRHAVASHVHVGLLVEAVQLPDRLREPDAGGERTGAEIGTGAFAHDAPVLDAL